MHSLIIIQKESILLKKLKKPQRILMMQREGYLSERKKVENLML